MDTVRFNANATAIYGKAVEMYDTLYAAKKIDSEVYSKGMADIVKTSLLTAVDVTTKEGLIAVQEATGIAQVQEIQEATKRNNASAAVDTSLKEYQLSCILPTQAKAMDRDVEMKDIQTIVALADAEVKKAQVVLADKEIEMKTGQLALMAKDITIKEMQTQMATIDVDVKSVQMQTAVKDMAAKEFQINCTMPLQALELQQKISDSAAMTDKQLRTAEVDLQVKNYQLAHILPAQAEDAIATAKMKTIQSDVLTPIQVEEASARMIETIKASNRAEAMSTVDIDLKKYQLNNLLPLQKGESEAKVLLSNTQAYVASAMIPYQIMEISSKSRLVEVQADVAVATCKAQVASAEGQVVLQGLQIEKTQADVSLAKEQKVQLIASVGDNRLIRAIQAQADLFSSLAMGKRTIAPALLCSYISDMVSLTGHNYNINIDTAATSTNTPIGN